MIKIIYLPAKAATYFVRNRPTVLSRRDYDARPGDKTCTQQPCPCSDSPESSGSVRNFRRESFESALDSAVADPV